MRLRFRLGDEAVHADDHALSGLDLLLVPERGLCDLALEEVLLDRSHDTAELLDPLEVLIRLPLELVRERLEEVGAAERVDGVDDTRLVRDHLLRPQREPHRLLGRQGQRLVERVRVQRLRPSEHRRERLESGPHDVHLRLLGRQRDAGGLRVEPQAQRTLVARAEPAAQLPRPDPSRGPVLRDLLEKVEMCVEEEREPRRELVHCQVALDRPLDVREPVRKRERELLRGRRARLADVVARHRDRVHLRQLARAPLDHVRHEPQRRLRREDPFLLGDVLLEDVGLHRAPQLRPRHALTLADAGVEREQDRRRRVDRHRGRDLAERNPLEEPRHVLERVDRHSLAPHLAERARMVRVVAHQRRHVERRRETRLPVLDQVTEAGVRLGGGAVARKLTHRPGPAPVHRLVDAARERELARVAEVALVVELEVLGRVERFDLDARDRRVARLPGRHSALDCTEPSAPRRSVRS